MRHFQSFLPNSETIKETEDSTCTYAVKKTTSTESETKNRSIKILPEKNECKKQMILLSVLVAKTNT